MRKIVAALFLTALSLTSFAQTDTLFTAKKKISCKISEINESEIKYRMADMPDGPVYVIDKSTVQRYTLSNGFTEVLIPDELSLEHEHREILHNRQVIKVHLFSPVLNHLSFSYEKVIKVGMNLDVEAGYINSAINSEYNGFGSVFNSPFHTGAYIKPGVKFFVGQDFTVKGLKYAHPLKGRYVKLDLAVAYINFQNLQAYDYSYGYSMPTRTITSNMNTVSYGAFVNYGRQFILGNILTLDYYVGIGFTGFSQSFTNPKFAEATRNAYYYGRNVTNYYGYMRTPSLGISFTGGFRLGYIIPDKAKPKKTLNPDTK